MENDTGRTEFKLDSNSIISFKRLSEDKIQITKRCHHIVFSQVFDYQETRFIIRCLAKTAPLYHTLVDPNGRNLNFDWIEEEDLILINFNNDSQKLSFNGKFARFIRHLLDWIIENEDTL